MIVRLRALVLALLVCLCAGPAAAATLEGELDSAGLQKLVQGQKKPVVLNFFATWCPPCRAEIPFLVRMHRKYEGKIAFVGMNVDEPSAQGKVLVLMTDTGIDYPVYRAGADVVQGFGIRSIPFNVAYDAEGRVAWAFAGLMDEAGFEEMLGELLRKR